MPCSCVCLQIVLLSFIITSLRVEGPERPAGRLSYTLRLWICTYSFALSIGIGGSLKVAWICCCYLLHVPSVDMFSGDISLATKRNDIKIMADCEQITNEVRCCVSYITGASNGY